MMTLEESRAWRPEILGWSDDILPAFHLFAEALPDGATVVEVGTAKGRSAIFLASELVRLGKTKTRIYCVDHEDCSPFLKVATKAERKLLIPIQGKSVEAAKRFGPAPEGFRLPLADLVFLDDDHSFEGCAASIAAWYPVVKAGGIFAGHDYSAIDFPGVVRAVDDLARGRMLHLDVVGTVWKVRP